MSGDGDVGRAACARRRPPTLGALRRRLARDEGSILPLVIGFAVLCLILVLVVVAATSLYLERKRLLSLADGAALVGAEAFDLSGASAGPPELRSESVRAAVVDYLEAVPTSSLDGLRIERAASDDGRSAAITLSSYWRPPLVAIAVPDGIRIEVTAVSRSVLG